MSRRPLNVDMFEILDAMTHGFDDPMVAYLDLKEGSVAYVFYDDLDFDDDEQTHAMEDDPERYVEIERIETRRQYDWMDRWTSTVDEPDIREMLELTLQMFQWWHQVRDGPMSRSTFRRKMKTVKEQVEELLDWGFEMGVQWRRFEDILKHREALWTFMDIDGVEPTNNHANAARGIATPSSKSVTPCCFERCVSGRRVFAGGLQGGAFKLAPPHLTRRPPAGGRRVR